MLTKVHTHSALSWELERHAYPPLIKIFFSSPPKVCLGRRLEVGFEGFWLNPDYISLYIKMFELASIYYFIFAGDRYFSMNVNQTSYGHSYQHDQHQI